MRMGTVVGTVTSTVHHPVYQARRLMVVAICDPAGAPTGEETIAVDTVQAGVGDRVLILKEGNSARAILGVPAPPMQEMIVGIIDRVDIRSASRTAAKEK